MDTDSNSDDIEEQRKKLITSVLDSSILNDSTASSSSGKKNKKKKRKEAEKVKLVFRICICMLSNSLFFVLSLNMVIYTVLLVIFRHTS